MPTITVLLRTLNAEPYLDDLFSILSRQTLPVHEVLVVDSGSRDTTVSRSEAAGARVVHLPSQQFTHAVSTNLGFREARGDWVAMLSQDALPCAEDWLERLSAPLEEESVAAVFGRHLPRPRCFPLERWEIERCYPPGPPPVVVYSNVNSLARRSVWEHLPFDESLLIAEDRAWAIELARAGHTVSYAAEAPVYHSHTYTLKEVYHRCRAEARARYQAEGVRHGWHLLWKAWPMQTVKDGLRLAQEGEPLLGPKAMAYRFCQFAGMVRGGRA